MRQIVLDTETTGLEAGQGHRIIEIGCVEMLNRRATGRHFHEYLDPERDIDAGAAAVHGLTRDKLAGKPRFAQVAERFLEFVDGAELVIHNAPFDVAFLDAELARWAALTGAEAAGIRVRCRVLDTLALAREMHPGQRNGLDALCKRYSHRQFAPGAAWRVAGRADTGGCVSGDDGAGRMRWRWMRWCGLWRLRSVICHRESSRRVIRCGW